MFLEKLTVFSLTKIKYTVIIPIFIYVCIIISNMKSFSNAYLAGLFVILMVVGTSSNAQTGAYTNTTNTKQNNSFKPDISVSLSSSFTSFGPGINTFGTSIFPSISFPVSNKFSLSTGIGYSSLFIGNSSPFNSQLSNYGHVFISGAYELNEKITIRGTGYKTFLLNPPTPKLESSSPYLDFSSQGVIMDVEYKVTDNVRINVGFEYRQQNYPIFSPGMNPINPIIYNASPFSNFSHSNSFNSF